MVPHVERDGTKIYWEATGEGEPLLLIMGFGLGREAWLPMLPMITGHRVILVDNRGTGDSDPPRPGLTLQDMADDCAAVLDAAGAGSAHVHGVSMGGMIAQLLALSRPEKVATLVLGATTPSPLRFLADPLSAVTLFQGSQLMESDPDAALDMLLPLVFSADFLAANPELRTFAKSALTKPAAPGTAELMMKAIVDLDKGMVFDTVDRLGELRMPTLVQHGTADLIIPVEAGRFLGETIEGAEYQELAGAGHGYHLEQPADVFSRLLGFLAAHPIGAA